MSGAVTAGVDEVRSEIRDKSVTVLDVRKEEEYLRGHLPAAANLPLAGLLADDSAGNVQKLAGSLGIGDETRVVIYDDTFGALASRVAWALEYIGHADVSLLNMTYSGWAGLGLELEEGRVDAVAKEHGASLQPGMVASAAYLEEAAGQDGTKLVDNRERLNYLEQHIPGAASLPYRMLGGPDSVLRPAAELRRLFENRGIPADSEVITYCGSVGTLSGLGYYALKSAGVQDAKLYVRSFREWKGLDKPTASQQDANYWDLSAE